MAGIDETEIPEVAQFLLCIHLQYFVQVDIKRNDEVFSSLSLQSMFSAQIKYLFLET